MGSCDHDWQFAYAEDNGDEMVYHYYCRYGCGEELLITVSKGDLDKQDDD